MFDIYRKKWGEKTNKTKINLNDAIKENEKRKKYDGQSGVKKYFVFDWKKKKKRHT